MRRVILLVVASLLLAPFAEAVDGVFEINQACAVNTGCFPGDSAGFPVTITGTSESSYRLTGSLVVPDANTAGLSVARSSVTIDLNGFEILRSGCEGATTSCAPASGTGSGVELTSPELQGISVKNGTVTGMGQTGVYLGDQAHVTNVRVRWNRLDGIDTRDGSTVSDNLAYQNGGNGISVSTGSTIQRNTSYDNDENGIQSFFGGSSVQNNTVTLNGGYGLILLANDAYLSNVITDNGSGTVQGGVNVGGNACNGVAACP